MSGAKLIWMETLSNADPSVLYIDVGLFLVLIGLAIFAVAIWLWSKQ